MHMQLENKYTIACTPSYSDPHLEREFMERYCYLLSLMSGTVSMNGQVRIWSGKKTPYEKHKKSTNKK